jgi:hypothetical protein
MTEEERRRLTEETARTWAWAFNEAAGIPLLAFGVVAGKKGTDTIVLRSPLVPDRGLLAQALRDAAQLVEAGWGEVLSCG